MEAKVVEFSVLNDRKQGISLILNEKLRVELKPDSTGKTHIDLPEYMIHAVYDSEEDALRNIQSDLIWVWQQYMDTDPSFLSPKALKVKERFEKLVKKAIRRDKIFF